MDPESRGSQKKLVAAQGRRGESRPGERGGKRLKDLQGLEAAAGSKPNFKSRVIPPPSPVADQTVLRVSGAADVEKMKKDAEPSNGL